MPEAVDNVNGLLVGLLRMSEYANHFTVVTFGIDFTNLRASKSGRTFVDKVACSIRYTLQQEFKKRSCCLIPLEIVRVFQCFNLVEAFLARIPDR